MNFIEVDFMHLETEATNTRVIYVKTSKQIYFVLSPFIVYQTE